MIRNYLKIGLRNLIKHPFFSLIHIFGLALGLTAFLFITQYNGFEKSYDRFHNQAERLYRLTTDDVLNGKIQVRDAMSFAPSGKALQEELPEVISYTTTYKTWNMVLRKDGQPLEETGIIAVDSNFLNLFNYKVLEGDPATMLTEPYTMVLTPSMAKKYFGQQNPMGQSIYVLGSFNRPFKITGLIEEAPKNIHYSFNTLVSLKSFQEQINNDNWNGFNYYSYLLLEDNVNLEQLRAKLPALTKKYLSDDTRLVFNLQPLVDIHLHSDFTFEPEIHGSAKAVGFLGIISIFIVLIAWVNYINLSTARAMERAREVGLRKVVGAQKAQLMGQFLTEALLINFIAAVVALILAHFGLPYFNSLVGKSIMTSVWTSPGFLSMLGGFFILGTFVTGFYPALVLSSFQPIGVLKGSFSRTKKGALLRKALVVVQFAASLILIASTLIIYQQIRYMTTKDLGIDTQQVLNFGNPGPRGGDSEQYVNTYKTFSEELLKLDGVQKVGGISNVPGGGSSDISSTSSGVKIVGKSDRVQSTVYITYINDKLQPALDIEVLAGRNFNHELAVDSSTVILNTAMLKLLNIVEPELAINEFFQFGNNPENRKYQIVGVFNDYNRSSLKNRVEPTAYFHYRAPGNTVVKLEETVVASTLGNVQQLWNKFFPDAPFVFTFLDQRFEKLYLEDRKFGFIFFNFALLAILVAIMGLFGLSSYLAQQRAKEVGIRKVLGASTSNIVFLFFRDFFWLILISIIIGLPLIYFAMEDWLAGYAYRIDFPWWVLFLAMIVVMTLAFFTVSYQTWKLALLNPAKTIRHE